MDVELDQLGVERGVRGADRLELFSVVTTGTGDDVVVRLVGDLDAAAAPRLRDELSGLALLGRRRVTLDLAAMTFIDSTGLSVIVGGLRRLRDTGGDLSLREPSASATKVFEITGLDRVFTVVEGDRPSIDGNGSGRRDEAFSGA